MNSFTTIFFPINTYQSNKHKLQNLRIRFGVNWNDKKIKENIPYNDILNVYKLFKSENQIINDESLKNRQGATGLWSSETDSLKIIVFNEIDEKESHPVLMIYRGCEEEFYRTLVKMCADIGCVIGKLVEDENGNLIEVFKKQRSIEEVERIRSLESSKNVIKELFNNRISELKNFNCNLSDEFVRKWEKCIEAFGYYDIRNLLNEIGNNNEGDE